jgi:S1-C subfamily serine protease
MFSQFKNCLSVQGALRYRVVIVMSLLVVCSFGTANAQTGKDTMLWEWTQRGDHHNAIVSVRSGQGTGTGVIVKVDRDKPVSNGFEGWCLTAWHVVSDDNGQREIKIEFQNGKRARRCRVIRHDEQYDLALLWVWVPEGIEAVAIADAPVELGHSIEFAGLGGNSDLKCCIRHFLATASVSTNPNQLFADAPLLAGDSGGPVFNDQQELTGIISGGWFWLAARTNPDSNDSMRVTWPARAGNLGAIQKLLDGETQKSASLASN